MPVLPGLRGTVDEILENIGQLDLPVLVKAAAGGGGKGMQIVGKADDLASALEQAQRQALEYFSNGELFVEKYLPQARHVEVQLMGDGAGMPFTFLNAIAACSAVTRKLWRKRRPRTCRTRRASICIKTP